MLGLSKHFAAAGLLASLGWASVASAETGPEIDFARDVQPIFQQHCVKCHGGVKREGGLSLLSARDVFRPGESGANPIVPSKPAASEIIRRISAADPDERMPAEGPALSAGQIQTLQRWIAAGATWPAHWSFAALQRNAPPAVKNEAWVRNPVDRFVLAKLEAEGLEPAPEADPYTLIRRLTLDLTGLPPTLEEIEAFRYSALRTPHSALDTLVDRLLASPHFGERFGRHWLDLARYADSDGYEVDKPRPDAYRWRDWVIQAVNQDLPLDQFTIEQFAGDLLPAATPQSALATAYHRQTLTNNEGGIDKEEYRLKAVLDRVSNMGLVWLGLTLGCAQCHNHPYDPITQREFYELAAIFNNADETEIELPDTPKDATVRKFRVLSQRGEPRTTRLLHRGDYLQPADEVQPGLLGSLPAGRRLALSGRPDGLERPSYDSASPDRLALARWLMDPGNPLTPRVAANRLWRHLFGRGLVRTPDDFGARGQPPTHPELLDWLAGEYIERGWRQKDLIRLIVTSSAYRQSSRHRSELESIDPENRLLARQNRWRVEGELVRDVHLAASGLLSHRIGGPSFFPPLPPELVKITFRSELPWKTSQGADRYRRGMYTFFKRSVPYPTLMLFDCPDSNAAAVDRTVSNTPMQALATLNNETFAEAAMAMARRVLENTGTDDRQKIELLFRCCLSRPPVAAELDRLLQLHETHRDWYRQHPQDLARVAEAVEPAAMAATASIVMNLDEFITRE